MELVVTRRWPIEGSLDAGRRTRASVCHCSRSKAAHAHLNISATDWQEMLADFRRTLDKFNVPAAEQGELVAINSTKTDIVAN